jgi:hypothetical protein
MLRNNIFISFLILVILLQSCIVPYEPNIDSKNLNKFVVTGQVSDNSDYQIVSISTSSSIGAPKYTPVSGCSVRIFDDTGNQFTMQEAEAGTYKVKIAANFLTPGASFKVEILTSDGVNIESDFDRMSECPPVDSIYYSREEIPTNIPGQVTIGLQFYTDLNVGSLNSHFFRWEAIETWKYEVDYPREWWYDGTVHRIIPPDYSRKICWSTQLVKNIYTLSTENLVENKYYRQPLNFVDNHTPKLIYGYSLLIKQHALSEAAYSYWDQLRINGSDQGGLYEKQPLSIEGNLHNNTNPDQKVLGFFGASSVKSKRIFLRNVENFPIDFTTYCTTDTLGLRVGFKAISRSAYPVYLAGNSRTYLMIVLSDYCVDCLTLGGTNIKPDYWPY